MNISTNIEIRRIQQNMTQKELCIRCHMSLGNYYLKIKNPDNFRIGELKKISKALKISLSDILFSEFVLEASVSKL